MANVSTDQENVIRLMPEILANKIAAGEVVQRPASAAKELMENAIDAGAERVRLIVKRAGSELIQVVDDGCGMSADDAVACFERHATSKIKSIEDLERIQTLGFRGEALASIAAVARVELRTKRREDRVGTRVRVEGGERLPPEPCATQAGTSVAVGQLFFNVPARRNFLKKPATEFKHIVDTFQHLALANVDVSFDLVHDGNEVYSLGGTGGRDFHENLQGRIGELLGGDHRDRLVPVDESTSYLHLRGFVGSPKFHRRTRGDQFLFINGRPIKDRSLDHAVRSAYGDLLPDGSYPFFALFIRIDPSHVDVNVHPAKAEVKFDDDRGIYAYIKHVVKRALGGAYGIPQVDPERHSHAPSPANARGRPTAAGGFRGFSATSGSAPSRPPRSSTLAPSAPARGDLSDRLYRPPAPDPARDEEGGQDVDAPLWQLHKKYVLMQIPSGLMVLDQNAAHERVLYERALANLRDGAGASQQLLFPRTFEFGARDYELLQELLPDLRALGFDVELFGGRSVVVRGIPSDVRSGDEAALLDELLDQFQAYADRLQLKGQENLAKSAARRMAIRPGMALTRGEMQALIDQLFECEMPYACPHGRPTFIKVPFEELDKRFGR